MYGRPRMILGAEPDFLARASAGYLILLVQEEPRGVGLGGATDGDEGP